MNDNTSYTFSFIPSNYVTGMTMLIEFPAQIKVAIDSPLCEPVAGMGVDMTCSFNQTQRTLMIKEAFPFLTAPRLLRFLLHNLTNPPVLLTTSTFKVYTYTSDGYLMDQRETDILINFVCSLPCKSCIQTNNTACATCFTDATTSITGLPYLLNNYCFEMCPRSYYVDAQYACQKCYTSACVSCTGSNDGECTLCEDGYSLINGNCVKYAD